MNKISLIPLALVTLIGVVFAATLLPDNATFPRVPTNPGTIGWALYGLFNADGSAKNTEKLAGKYASGYLQNRDCSGEPINTVWVGVDTTGRGICGRLITPLASIGKFTGLTAGVQVRHIDNSVVTPAIGDILVPWDIVQTNWGTATITFTDDLSVLRLDVATVVELSTGENTSGQSVAQAILSDGRLWGRILTSTGVNLGWGGMVAGVRGTSVSVEESAGVYTLAIIDSRNPTNAATLSSTLSDALAWSLSAITSPVYSERQLTYLSWAMTYPLPVSKASLLNLSIWGRENMKKDIDYLMGLSPSTLINEELAIATPIGIAEKDAICRIDTNTDGWRWWDNFFKCQPRWVIAFADYTQGSTNMILGYSWVLTYKEKSNSCPNKGTQDDGGWYSPGNENCWPALSESCNTWDILVTHDMSCPTFSPIAIPSQIYHPKVLDGGLYGMNWWTADCQVLDEYNSNTALRGGQNNSLDPTSGGGKLTLSCATPGTQLIPNIGTTLTAIPSTWVSITGGSYLSYATGSLPPLAGKTITIELDSPITNTNAVLLLLDSLPTGTANPAFYINSTGEPICITQATSWCSASRVGSTYTLYLGSIVATRFEIGNSLLRNKPISRMIKKITIK